VGLPARQRRVLDRIEDTLAGSDPRLAATFAIFERLTRDEEMPRIEELRHRMAILFLRIRLWMTPSRTRPRGRLRRRPLAVLFPLALVMATATIVLVARFSGSPRCTSAATVAAAKQIPRGKLSTKAARMCPALNPLFTGR
jgi:Protein of unknown function (DUF3040)